MSPTPNPQELFTPFLPSTYVVPQDQERMGKFLVDTFCNISDTLNDKKIGVYIQTAEVLNGNKFFYDTTQKTRSGYQVIARIPSFIPMRLTLDTTPTYPLNNVNPQFIVSHVWGSASKPCSATGAGDGDYFSFYSQGDARIQFTMSDTEIVITTDGTTAAYQGFIFIEYIRDGI